MQIGDLLRSSIRKYPQLEPNDIKTVLMKLNRISSYTEFVLNQDRKAKKLITFKHYLRLLKRQMPVQYILNESYFYDEVYYVNKNVLIPRIETEELTRILISEIKDIKEIIVADVGTGSGVIAASVKKYTKATVYASDVSNKALKVARKNNKQSRINFLKGDLLKPYIDKKIKIDYVIANLPYIKKYEILGDKVKKFEPEIALYWPKDNIFARLFVQTHIVKKGKNGLTLFLEFGFNQAEELTMLAQLHYGKSVKIEIIKDLNNRERFLIVRGIK